MRKRGIISVITSVCLMCGLISPASCEEQAVVEIQPLLDAVAAAAVVTDESAEIYHNAQVSSEFANSFIMFAEEYGIVSRENPLLSSDDGLKQLISTVFDTNADDFTPELSLSAENQVYGVRLQDANVSPNGDTVIAVGDVYMASKPINAMDENEYSTITWLDKRASAELRRSTESPCGWIVSSFSMDNMTSMDISATESVSANMIEYYNESQGFSLQYPADFLDYAEETDGGISATLPNNAAFFYAIREDKAVCPSLQELENRIMSGSPDASITSNESTKSMKVFCRFDGYFRYDFYILGDSCTYHAVLSYKDYLDSNYAAYAECMGNSFTAFENMVG